MTHAYSEYYLNDAKTRLAQMLDYAVNDEKLDAEWFIKLFLQSGVADRFEVGNPSVVAGASGVELARDVIGYAYKNRQFAKPTFVQDRSPEYWAGWALAEYQWYSRRRFKEIFSAVSITDIIAMYHLYHEMDIRQFIDTLENRIKSAPRQNRLKKLRENRGLAQTDLAELSGVNIRSIQMYEQGTHDIDKAQAHTLYKLSRVLGCTIEDLLESPSESESDKSQPKVITIPEGSNVALSQEVYYFMLMQVPFGRITRYSDIEAYLARKFGVHHVHEFDTTAMGRRNLNAPEFKYIEKIIDNAPEHREVSPVGYLEHGDDQAKKLKVEGHEIVQKGAKKKDAVKDYKKYLFNFDKETDIDLETLKKIDQEGLFDYLK